jgi:hypothetical protein
VIAKLLSIGLRTWAKHNGCFDALAPFVVWNANHCCVDNIRMAQQGIFNLGWCDVLTTTNDRVIGATLNE